MELDPEAKTQFQKRFLVISLLGKGSFGEVYECQDKLDGETYAVKVISKSKVKKSKIDCLREEAKILSTITHSNIVKVYEFVQTDTFIFLKMEIVKNGTLEKLIRKRWQTSEKFTDEECATIMSSLLRAVNHIHSVNIIHRDLKPENILLPNEDTLGELKIADFGLSTKLDFRYPKTATSKCGTMLYMAPEILYNYTYTKAVDVWSCSIIMYMLCTGKHPFYEPKMKTEQYKAKLKTIKFPPIPNNLAQDLLSKINKVEPNERYTTQQALRHPWLTRNFDDPIPLSLHETFSCFQKSHQISHIFKALTVLRSCFKDNSDCFVPPSYVATIANTSKKDIPAKDSYQRGKLRSRQTPRDICSLTEGVVLMDKEIALPGAAAVNYESPLIMKLDKIFNNLFGKRGKLQSKTYTQQRTRMSINSVPKQNTVDLPNISACRQRIEQEILKVVNEYKANLDKRQTRILPTKCANQAIQAKAASEKDELKIELRATPIGRSKLKKRCSLKIFQLD